MSVFERLVDNLLEYAPRDGLGRDLFSRDRWKEQSRFSKESVQDVLEKAIDELGGNFVDHYVLEIHKPPSVVIRWLEKNGFKQEPRNEVLWKKGNVGLIFFMNLLMPEGI